MSESNPWTTCSSKIVYRNSWIALREDQVICPDGSSGIYGVIECNVATAVAAIDNEGLLYMVGQYRYPTRQYSWEVIEGGSRAGETPIQAAQRELGEEAGLSAASWVQLGGEVHLSNCFSAERGIIFLAREMEVGLAKPDATEVLQVRRIPLQEAVSMALDGGVQDAMSIIAILRADSYLRANRQQ